MMRRRWIWLVIGICLGGAAKMATAFVGVPLLFSPPVITTATGAALSTWAAIAAGVGAMVYSIGLTDGNGNVFMTVPVNPNAPQPVPPGWTANSNPANAPMPPAVAQGSYKYCGVASVDYCVANTPQFLAGSATEAAEIVCGGCGGGGGCATVLVSGTTYACMRGGVQVGANIPVQSGFVCPTGYGGSSSGCTLVDAPSVSYPPDQTCGLKFQNGTMSWDSRDPDCTGAPPGMLSPDGKTVQVTSGGNRVQVQVNGDGTVTVTQWSATSSGNTQINSMTAGNPSSSASSTIQTSAQSTTSATGQGAFSQSPSASTSSSSFPDDYARDATVQAGNIKLGQIDSKLADVKTKLSSDDSKADDPTPRSDSEIQGAFFPGTFDSLRGWSMPARAVGCPTWSFSLWGHTYTIDAQCTLIEQQRALMSAICLLVYGIVALFIVLGA